MMKCFLQNNFLSGVCQPCEKRYKPLCFQHAIILTTKQFVQSPLSIRFLIETCVSRHYINLLDRNKDNRQPFSSYGSKVSLKMLLHVHASSTYIYIDSIRSKNVADHKEAPTLLTHLALRFHSNAVYTLAAFSSHTRKTRCSYEL